jgi:ankyrin repeat protein
MLDRIADGRTDLVFELLASGEPADWRDPSGFSLLQWCGHHGDVSAIRFLIASGAALEELGVNFDLNGAVFHGHRSLCEFLIERGADVNHPLPDTGETPLHLALTKPSDPVRNEILALLLRHGADPNRPTKPGVETESFMRDVRTKGETPLHRAAAFGDEVAIRQLLEAGASPEARDVAGDTPLSWASWHLRPRSILKLLCFGPHRIRG